MIALDIIYLISEYNYNLKDSINLSLIDTEIYKKAVQI